MADHRRLRRFLEHRTEPSALTGLALPASALVVVGLAVAVAATRVFLGVHWFTAAMVDH